MKIKNYRNGEKYKNARMVNSPNNGENCRKLCPG